MTGGRDYSDYRTVARVLDQLLRERGIDALCHGGATGADAQAHVWAVKNGITPKPFPAFWEGPCAPLCPPGHRVERDDGSDYCPLAGHLRNQQMLDEFKPDLVVAFPGGRGTADMVKRAILAQQRGELEVMVV